MSAPPPFDRAAMGAAIAEHLRAEKDRLRTEFDKGGRIPAFALDDALPLPMARAVAEAFPRSEALVFKDTLRERKHVGVAMDAYDPLIKEAVYAWQEPEVVTAIAEITRLAVLQPDPELYAGGISAMGPGAYLRPHIDNSHDGERRRYRALNLLHYVSPGWNDTDGGALELWDDGPKARPRVFPARFNRLVVMATFSGSWHSVSKVTSARVRRCVSNYYFTPLRPRMEPKNYFHVTSFRGRPEEPLLDAVLRIDSLARNVARIFKPHGVVKTTHVYRRGPAGG